jgi:outer membrane protein assembly factor BamA
MKKIIVAAALAVFFNVSVLSALSAELSSKLGYYNGKIVKSINVTTKRIKPSIIEKKFLISQGQPFDEEDYELAKQSLHNMRIFKELNFDIGENEDSSININIDAKDSFYVFPMIFGTSGSKSTFAAMLIEANVFKRGETAFTFGAFNSDGYAAAAAFGFSQTFWALGFSDFEYEEKIYENNSYNSSGLFSSSSDENGKRQNPVKKYDVDAKSVKVSLSKTFFEKTSASLGFDFSRVKYFGSDVPQDKGNHNKITASISHSKNFNSGAAGAVGFGSIFGIGLSDVKDLFSQLPKPKYGYFVFLSYENAGSHTGSDFVISKLSAKTAGKIEFTKRHFLTLEISAAKAFETPYFDRIRSGEVMSAKGIYSKDFRGKNASGASLSLFYYLLKNKKGMLSFTPFIETSAVWDNGVPRNQTGIGAGIFYRFWRIPFPLGLHYTYDFSDGSYNLSAIFGG